MAMNQAMMDLINKGRNKYARNTSKVVKIKEGKTRVRILSNVTPGEQFWADQGVHWIKADENGKPLAVVGCHDTVFKRPCPVCAAAEQAILAATDDESLKLMKSWKSKGNILLNAIIRDGADASADPQILELTTSTFEQVLSIMEDWGDITDLVEGMDIIIERKGKGMNDTKYTVGVAPISPKFPKEVPAEVLEKCHNLIQYITREHFKDEDDKAIRAISNISGITPSLAIAGRGNQALLAGASVPGADDSELQEIAETAAAAVIEEEVEVMPTKPVKAAVVAKPAAAAPLAAAKPAAVAAKPAAVKPAAVAAAPAEGFGAPLDAQGIDDMLAELNNL